MVKHAHTQNGKTNDAARLTERPNLGTEARRRGGAEARRRGGAEVPDTHRLTQNTTTFRAQGCRKMTHIVTKKHKNDTATNPPAID